MGREALYFSVQGYYRQPLGYSSYTELERVLKADLEGMDSSHDLLHNKCVPLSNLFTP